MSLLLHSNLKMQQLLTATLTADSKLLDNTQRINWLTAFVFIDVRAFGDTQWTRCVQLAVMILCACNVGSRTVRDFRSQTFYYLL